MQLAINIPDDLFLSINESSQNLVNIAKQKLTLELYKNQIPAIDDYDIEAELKVLKG